MSENIYTLKESGAFIDTFILEPYQEGLLDGLTFAVKDNIDLAGKTTSYGSRPWGEDHCPAVYNALCVDQILGAGATCIGRTVADEFTYSLDGESHFYGTPLNPRAPDRIPGGSSSGSASAVACGLVDFALGTDSGGSVRVPASLCGIWGMRPSLHRVSEAGVLPFMPSVSTVGALSKDIQTLDKVMRVLLSSPNKAPAKVKNLYLLAEAFSISDASVQRAVKKIIARLEGFDGVGVATVGVGDILGEGMDLTAINTRALRNLQTAEFMNTVGGWIETLAPEVGPGFTAAYQNVKTFDRTRMHETLILCERLFQNISSFIKPGDILCFPTTPTIAPKKGSLTQLEPVMDFYDRTMAITSFSGAGRLPEISIPGGTVDGVPVGLSLAAGHYQDEFLLDAVSHIFRSI